MDGALAEFLAHAGIDRLHQTRYSAHFIAADADVILLYIDDAPFDEGIHHHVFLFRRDETLRLPGIQRQDARIKEAHVLHQRHLEIQTRSRF